MQGFYTVVINGSSANSAAPSDGYIDNTRLEAWYASTGTSLESTPAGLTLALATAKRRANVRYDQIVAQIGLMANPMMLNYALPGASATTPASSATFEIGFNLAVNSVATQDETTPGVLLTGIAAVQRCVARALIYTQTQTLDVWNPTSGTTTGNATQAPRYGTLWMPMLIGPLANSLTAATAMVTVTYTSLLTTPLTGTVW